MANLKINGKTINVDVEPDTPLLWAIRENVGLTGTKYGCGIAQCGACTVHLDGVATRSCVTPLSAVSADQQIVTIEGLGVPEAMHPMQRAFVQHDAYQCGYCTPGQVCSAVAMLEELKQGMPSQLTADVSAHRIPITRAELRERMSGNLCRCGAYDGIVEAIVATCEEDVA